MPITVEKLSISLWGMLFVSLLQILGCGGGSKSETQANDVFDAPPDVPAPVGSDAKILFELDFNNIPTDGLESERMPYQGAENAHPGGGRFRWLGGGLNRPYGDGTQDPNHFQNIHMSSEPAAQGALPGHTQALKCHWAPGYAAEFSRNHVSLDGWEGQRELYIAFMFKFGDGSGNFVWPVDQIKFVKIQSTYGETNDPEYVTANWKIGMSPSGNGNLHYTHRPQIPGVDGRFDANIWAAGVGPFDISDYLLNDDYDNGIGPNGEDQIFEVMANVWYHLETRIKLNTANNSDGLRETWIDGVKIMGVEKVNLTGGRSGTLDVLELFHVRQDSFNGVDFSQISGKDMPGFMGGKLIVSTGRIGLQSFGL